MAALAPIQPTMGFKEIGIAFAAGFVTGAVIVASAKNQTVDFSVNAEGARFHLGESGKMSKRKPTPDEEPKKETMSNEESGEETTPDEESKETTSDEESGEETTPGDEPKKETTSDEESRDETNPDDKPKDDPGDSPKDGNSPGEAKQMPDPKISARQPGNTAIGTAIGATVGAGVALVGLPLFISALGFTGAGIAAGSIAAKMMSAAAIANGGGVAAGSTVAVLQSVGAAGFSLGTKIGLTSVLSTVGGTCGAWLSKGKKSPNDKPKKG